MAATALAQRSNEIEVPEWVLAEHCSIYRLIASRKGEEPAASIVRRLKKEGNADATWSLLRLTILIRMWTEGATTAATAVAIGDGITRNAVIGKRARLGLTSSNTRPSPQPRTTVPTRPTRIVSKAAAPEHRRPTPVVPVIVPDDPVEAPVEGGIELFDLEYHHCRWPVADGPPMRFCGERKAVDAPAFCKAHALRAYAGRAPVSRSILKATQR